MPPPLVLAPPADMEPADVDDVIEADPDLEARYGQARRMAIAGGITMGVGVIMSMSAGVSLGMQSLYMDVSPGSGDPQVIAEYVLLGIGASAITAGAIVMGIGLGKRSRVIDEAEGRLGTQASITPMLGKRTAGLSLTLRW